MPITPTQAADAIPEFFLRTVIRTLHHNLRLAALIPRDAGTDIQQRGNKVSIPKRGALTAKLKTTGNPIVADSPANDKVEITLDQHGYIAWSMDDIVRSTTIEEALDYAQDGMRKLAQQIEEYLIGVILAGAAGSTGTFGTDLDPDDILAADVALDNALAPSDGRVMMVSTKDKGGLLSSGRFIDQSIRGQQATGALADAVLGRMYGFDVYSSTLMPAASGSPVETQNLAFLPECAILASRPLVPPPPGTGATSIVVSDPITNLAFRYTTSYDGTNQVLLHVIDTLYGAAMQNPALALEVRS